MLFLIILNLTMIKRTTWLYIAATEPSRNVPDNLFTTKETVAVVAVATLAPILIPYVIGGVLIGVSVQLLVHELKRAFVCDRYSNNDFQHRMYHHIKFILERSLTEKRLRSYIFESYFQSLLVQVDEIVSLNARKEAETRMLELDIIGKDYRNTEQLLREISRAKPQLDLLVGLFRSYELVYESDDYIDDTQLQIGDYIGGGQFSDVYGATANTEQVAVKVLKCHVQPENTCKQLRELQTFR